MPTILVLTEHREKAILNNSRKSRAHKPNAGTVSSDSLFMNSSSDQRLKSWKGARFVGPYASFPIEKNVRRTRILVELLGLEQSLYFNTMKFGRLSKGVRKTRFSNERLSEVLKSIDTGEDDWLQLYSSRLDKDWVKAKENQTYLSWKSSEIAPINRSLSPIDKNSAVQGVS